jgi:hypothetical protein
LGEGFRAGLKLEWYEAYLTNPMFFKFFFSRWSLEKQVSFLKKKAIAIGARTKDNRRIFIYMYRDVFVEVVFQHDDPEGVAESTKLVKGLKKLTSYMENEFKEANF